MGPLLDDRTAPLFDPTKVRYVGTANSGTRVCVTLKGGKIAELRGRAEGEGQIRRQRAERFDLRIRLSAQAHLGRAVGHRAGLSRHARHGARHGARRDRRPLRLGLVELQVAEAGLAARQQGQRAAAGQPRSASRADQDGRADGVRVRQERGRPQGGRADHQPDRVPPLLHRAAGHAAGAARSPARGVRQDHGRSAIPRRRREARASTSSRCPGAKVQEVVAKLYATPPAIVERARKAIRPD